MLENKEIRFEQDIETSLTSDGGWKSQKFQELNFDKDIGLDLDVLIKFIADTQPKAWVRYQKIYGSDSPQKLYKRFEEEVSSHGILHVLRNGITEWDYRSWCETESCLF